MGSLGIQFIPYLIIAGFYAWIIFLIAKRRNVNPWPWVIGTLVPIFGFVVAGVFFVLTLLSMLDRLNALERDRTFS